MATDEEKREEVCKVLLSLLVSRQGATPVTVLDREYYDLEKERIPWRKFGHTDLIDFLKSAPQQFSVESYNGGHYVRGIAEKSRHVSSLVARQKSKPLSRMQRPRRPTMTRYIPQQRMRSKLPPNYLHHLVQYIRNYPDGVSMQRIREQIEQQLPSMIISLHDLRVQLYELSHQLRIDGEIIYPVQVNDTSRDAKNCKQSSPLMSLPQNALYSAPVEMCGGDEGPDFVEELDHDDYDFTDDETFIPAGCISKNPSKLSRLRQRFAMNFTQNAQFSEQNAKFYHDNNNDVDINTYSTYESDSINAETINDIEHEETLLISNRTQSRLRQLLEKRPEGIWCAELPDLYLKEYKVHLNYLELGFTSVRAYASYLKDIFYMTRKNTSDDFLLFSADKKPKVTEETIKPNPAEGEASSRERYDNYYGARAQLDDDNDDLPIPADVPSNITKRFAPENVMNYNDSVDCIRVTDLVARKRSLKAYVIEVFNPSFFWIQLWENKKVFESFMKDLTDFYKFNSDKYTIPKVALKKGLNCACIYANIWHRGIIKFVKPDFRVTVLFYDFGTLKTYAPEDVYYLHKRFSSLPAQAIPCCLYNIRPILTDRWKRSVNNQFIDRIDGQNGLLDVTIKSIDEVNNSMMVVLTDISEDGETDINEWLVKEKLAKRGKLVRIHRNFLFHHYLRCNNIESCESDISNVVSLNEARYNKNHSISVDERAHKLSNVKGEDSEKGNLDDLRNVPARKRLLYQKLLSLGSQNIAKSQSSLEEDKPKILKPAILQKLKSLDAASNSKASISRLSEVNGSFKDNSQQINSDIKVDVESRNTEENHYGFKMEFGMRDSDDEESTKNDFGDFRSLYGGQGSNEPFDWSIMKDDQPSCKSIAACNFNSRIEEYENDVENKSESHNERKVSHADQYFLNFTRKEEEYYSPEMNVEYNDINIYQVIAMLRNKMQMHYDKCTQVIIPQHLLETLRHGDHSQDAPECNANIVKINGSVSSSETIITQIAANKNGNVCETKADWKMKNNESRDTDLKLAPCNVTDNGDNNNSKISERDAKDSFDFRTKKEGVNPKFKIELLNRIREFQMNSSKSSISKKSSSSSEQLLSSSYSHNSSTDIISSTDNDQSQVLREERLEQRINKLRNFTRSASSRASMSLNSFKLSNDSDTNNLLPLKNEIAGPPNAHNDSTRYLNYSSENDSAVSSDSATQRLLNQSFDSIASSVESKQPLLNQTLEIDSNASFDKSKNYQLNATIATSRSSRFLQMLKETQQALTNDSELDSDDLSDEESIESNKSCDAENNKSADEPNLEISELPTENTNVSVRSKLPDDAPIKDNIFNLVFNDNMEAFGELEDLLQYFAVVREN